MLVKIMDAADVARVLKLNLDAQKDFCCEFCGVWLPYREYVNVVNVHPTEGWMGGDKFHISLCAGCFEGDD